MPKQQRSIGEWAEVLNDAFEDSVQHDSNETELRERVHQVILDAIDDLFQMSHLTSSGEHNTKKKGRSPADRLYGGVVVEWEWNMSTPGKKEHGAQQAVTYMNNLRTKQQVSREVFTAVVCDGREWAFLHYDADASGDGLLTPGAPATYGQRFTWVPNSPGACRRFLELIGTHGKVPITGKALTSHFGPGSQVAQKLVTDLSSAVAGRIKGDRVDTLYDEWRRALDVVYGDLDSIDSALSQTVQKSYRLAQARPLGDSLFVLHTYFALVSRLIAVELLAVAIECHDDAPSAWLPMPDDDLLDRLRGLEKGALPGDLDITNLFEADVFSWWADKAETDRRLLGSLRDLLSALGRLAFPRVVHGPQRAGDVLRDLYQSLVPRELRKALGEFLTPHWLAEACRERLVALDAPMESGRVLDHTCGTGTFIVPVLTRRLAALRHSSQPASNDQVQAVLNTVTGIDLNPVAVTATRVNYVLALGDFAQSGALTLPVWRADSVVIPDMAPAQGELLRKTGIAHSELITSLSEPFTIPLSLDSASKIATLREILEDGVGLMSSSTTDDEVDDERDRFEAAFQREFGPGGERAIGDGFTLEDETLIAVNLFDQVAKLAREGRNGVWARIIENAFAPRFAGRFDVVIGNPPWLSYGKMPSGWRTRSERVWRSVGLWQPPTGARKRVTFQDTDIAVLVFAVALLQYAKPESFVGLLVPSNIITGEKSGQAFRRFHLRPNKEDEALFPDGAADVPFKPLYVDDWSKTQPFSGDAANAPAFLVVRRDHQASFPISGSRWTRAEHGTRTAGIEQWQGANGMRAMLTEGKGSLRPVTGDTTSVWSFSPEGSPDLLVASGNSYTFGKGLDTRGANGLFFVKTGKMTAASGKKKALIRVTNDPSAGRNKNVVKVDDNVEAELVYPVLRGRDVQDWVAEPSGHFLLPHSPTDLSKPIEYKTLRRDYPRADSWLRHNKAFLTDRRTPPSRNWDMSATGSDWCRVDGPLQHMGHGYSVVFREISTEPQAAFVEAYTDYDLGRSVRPLIDHKLSFLTLESREEALYLTAMLNSTPMKDLLRSFVSGTSISPAAIEKAPIPEFDPTSQDMKRLAALGGDIVSTEPAKRAERASELQEEVDGLVLSIAGAESTYVPQPKKVRAKRNAPSEKGDSATLF